MSGSKQRFDLINRGEKRPTPAGTLTFVGLRLADIPLQYALLSPEPGSLGVRLLSYVGATSIFTDTSRTVSASLLLPLSASFAGVGSLSALSMSHMTPTSALLLLMSAGSTLKQIYWQVGTSQESFPPSAAAAVSAYNTIVNSANTLLFLALSTTSLRSQPQILLPYGITLPVSTIVGTLLYITGMAIETGSETQRAAFKKRPENEGEVCKEGLWSWARHINYFGYALWRGGYCMAASGWIGGIVMGLWQGYHLSQQAVGVLDEYCSERYGAQWVQFKKDVPSRIIPGIY